LRICKRYFQHCGLFVRACKDYRMQHLQTVIALNQRAIAEAGRIGSLVFGFLRLCSTRNLSECARAVGTLSVKELTFL
jgi:hypothetical protein